VSTKKIAYLGVVFHIERVGGGNPVGIILLDSLYFRGTVPFFPVNVPILR
jgi:hypothetical protein